MRWCESSTIFYRDSTAGTIGSWLNLIAELVCGEFGFVGDIVSCWFYRDLRKVGEISNEDLGALAWLLLRPPTISRSLGQFSSATLFRQTLSAINIHQECAQQALPSQNQPPNPPQDRVIPTSLSDRICRRCPGEQRQSHEVESQNLLRSYPHKDQKNYADQIAFSPKALVQEMRVKIA